MVEAEQDLDLPQRALAVRLVLKRADLLDGHTAVGHVVQGGAVWDGEAERAAQVTQLQQG